MEQYKHEGSADTPANPVKVSEESKQIRSVESTVKHLQETVHLQQQEIAKLHREIGRLKGNISDIISLINSRG